MQLLRNSIIEEVNKKGKITFAGFMQMALYHPKYGYYNSDKERVGRFGDYYTSPAVHGIFGELIARQLEEMWRIMGGGLFTIVEMGANKGWLCCDIIQSIKKEYPVFYDNFHYIIVESNPFAKEKQKKLLNSFVTAKMNSANKPQKTAVKENLFDYPITQHTLAAFCIEEKETHPSPLLLEGKDLDGKVSWHTYSEDGFSFDSIQGCVLSNEFVDALPVHRLKLKNKVLKEIYVGYNDSGFYEIDDEVSPDVSKQYIETFQMHLSEGQECEINLVAAEWLRHVSEKLRKGFVLTIDYGNTIDGLYRENGSGGTSRCYYKHTVNRDYYERPGDQDITAHVNFTHLMNTGMLAGLEVTGFTKQSNFLLALGILERLNNTDKDIETILKVKNLFHPEVMGDVFKVLIQHKNVEHPQLTGLRPLHSLAI